MVDRSLQDYFRIISTYNRSPRGDRPKILEGYIMAASVAHRDETTRQLVARFYAKEKLRYEGVA